MFGTSLGWPSGWAQPHRRLAEESRQELELSLGTLQAIGHGASFRGNVLAHLQLALLELSTRPGFAPVLTAHWEKGLHLRCADVCGHLM